MSQSHSPLFLADDIRAMREQMCMSRTELAHLLHYSRLTVRDWEQDRLLMSDHVALAFLDLYMKRYPSCPTHLKNSLRFPLAS